MIDRQGFIEMLKEQIVEIKFKKVDGNDRRMQCTLKPDIIEAGGGTPQPKVVTRPDGSDSQVVKVWDTEKSAWRSFRWENFISIAAGDKIQ